MDPAEPSAADQRTLASNVPVVRELMQIQVSQKPDDVLAWVLVQNRVSVALG